MNKIELVSYDNGKKVISKDNVVNEHEIRLFVNQKEENIFQSYPLDINELVTGYLVSQRYIYSINDLESYTFDETRNECHVQICKSNLRSKHASSDELASSSSSVRSHNLQNSFVLKPFFVLKLMNKFINLSTTFKDTGAVHTAAITDREEIKYFYDDIGRHNAIDKCVGKALKEDIDLKEHILLVTCRMSSGIISKVVNSGIPVIISRAPPTSTAIDLAKKNNTTIIGFCRGTRFNIYSHPNRIEF